MHLAYIDASRQTYCHVSRIFFRGSKIVKPWRVFWDLPQECSASWWRWCWTDIVPWTAEGSQKSDGSRCVCWGLEPTFKSHGSYWAPSLYRCWLLGSIWIHRSTKITKRQLKRCVSWWSCELCITAAASAWAFVNDLRLCIWTYQGHVRSESKPYKVDWQHDLGYPTI